MAPPEPSPPAKLSFPLSWMLSNASPAAQYRAIKDVARLENVGKEISVLPLAHRPALELAAAQSADGTWNGSMLAVPKQGIAGVGTIHAARRLLEYGWDRDSPPLACARRVLFRLLAEDEAPEFMYELRGKSPDEDMVRRGRAILRESAAAALAQAGYEDDPRVRGAARRMLTRVTEYIRSPLAEKPFIRIGNQHVLPAEAAPPSIYGLSLLAQMPKFRTEYHEEVDRLYSYLAQPLPRQAVVQQCGSSIVEQPHLVLGDLLSTRNVADSDVPWALHWLEIMARLGFLRRNEGWSRLLDRFIDARDRDCVWRPARGIPSPNTNPFTWHMWPLDEPNPAVDGTVRVGLIARASGMEIEVV
jgi:hypothetical protein